MAIALLQQEKSSHYVTDQVTLMLRIMDNWHLTKQTDTGANGVPVMESGAASAIAICSRTGECEGITPVGSRANSTRLTAAAATSAGVVEGTTATAGSAASAGSVGSTPRTSRSNSNAPLLDTVGGVGTGATPRHSRTNSAVTSDVAASAVAGTSIYMESTFSVHDLGYLLILLLIRCPRPNTTAAGICGRHR